ncbi:transglutaminase-like domain-containing protein [Clostridiaceae bacterium M8S5]|nr:transglutaminase-like domain-containing protein [Clostridiaceae bacterium M8S5]
MKKIVSLLCIIVLLVSNVAVFATVDTNVTQKQDLKEEVNKRLKYYQSITHDTTIYSLSFNSMGEAEQEVITQGKVMTPSYSDIVYCEQAILKKIDEVVIKINSFCKTQDEKNLIYAKILENFPFKTAYKYSKEPAVLNINGKDLHTTLKNIDSAFIFTKGQIEKQRELIKVFKNDLPSKENIFTIAQVIKDKNLPKKFQKDFQRPLTIGEYSELLYEITKSQIKIDNYTIREKSIKKTHPAYVKLAYILGYIDTYSDLDKTLTREEMANIVAPTRQFSSRATSMDFETINPLYLDAVGNSGMKLIGTNFRPKEFYKLEDAIVDVKGYSLFNFKVRGLLSLRDLPSHYFILDGNTITLHKMKNFDYAVEKYTKKLASNISINLSTHMLDYGPFCVDVDSKNKKITFTVKEGCSTISLSVDWRKYNFYFTDNHIKNKYEIRAIPKNNQIDKFVKGDKANQEVKLIAKNIISKIIQPNMNQTQKIKAIHDYVAKNLTYSGDPSFVTTDVALAGFKTGKGVCTNYATMFHYLCQEANIQSRVLSYYDTFVGPHTWNVVYVNNKWYHVDVTCDDAKNKITYKYFMKTSEEFMPTHGWEAFGNIVITNYKDIDPMNIKSTIELRLFLTEYVNSREYADSDIDFKLADPSIDTNLRFLVLTRGGTGRKFSLSYNKKTKVYTLIDNFKKN